MCWSRGEFAKDNIGWFIRDLDARDAFINENKQNRNLLQRLVCPLAEANCGTSIRETHRGHLSYTVFFYAILMAQQSHHPASVLRLGRSTPLLI